VQAVLAQIHKSPGPTTSEQFLLELGVGFAFLGSQYRLQVGGVSGAVEHYAELSIMFRCPQYPYRALLCGTLMCDTTMCHEESF
jgi:hypothetical protein